LIVCLVDDVQGFAGALLAVVYLGLVLLLFPATLVNGLLRDTARDSLQKRSDRGCSTNDVDDVGN